MMRIIAGRNRRNTKGRRIIILLCTFVETTINNNPVTRQFLLPLIISLNERKTYSLAELYIFSYCYSFRRKKAYETEQQKRGWMNDMKMIMLQFRANKFLHMFRYKEKVKRVNKQG